MRTTALIAVLGMVLWAAPATAQKLYKWVDERGVTHYSEKPPADKGGAPVTLRDATGGASRSQTHRGASAATDGDLRQQEREFQRRQRERDSANDRRLRDSAQRGSSSACTSAQRDLYVMERTSTHHTFDAMAQARDRVARACR